MSCVARGVAICDDVVAKTTVAEWLFGSAGMARANEEGQSIAETPLAALTAGSSGLPPAGGNRSRRRNSGSTTGMEAIMKRTQAIRQSVYPESTLADSDSDWEE